MTRRRMLQAALAAAVLAVASPPAGAQPSPRQQAADLSHELMSPFCPGKLLAECTSSYAGELRDQIATRIASGETAEAVKADLVRQYGAEILGAPPPEGLGLLAWLLPALFGVGMTAAIGWKVAAAARTGAVARPALAGAVDAEALARLDDELRDLD
ncbi:MAG: cytochrome c-type biogenesis protein CcmH [Vicinamibacterales bacterium]